MSYDHNQDLEETEEQRNNRRIEHLRPWMYQKGQSGNPSGRPPGISMKEYIRMKFRHMTDEEKEAFLDGMSKKDILEFGEGKAESKTDITSKGDKIVFMPAEVINRMDEAPSEAE